MHGLLTHGDRDYKYVLFKATKFVEINYRAMENKYTPQLLLVITHPKYYRGTHWCFNFPMNWAKKPDVKPLSFSCLVASLRGLFGRMLFSFQISGGLPRGHITGFPQMLPVYFHSSPPGL